MSKSLFQSLILGLFIFMATHLAAQSVGINTNSPHPSAALEVFGGDKGLLIPRMTSGERSSIMSPANGLLVYDVTSQSFWYYKLSEWVEITTGVFKKTGGIVHNTGNHGTDDFVFGSPELPPATNISDTLMFFDKSKGAFRAGRLSNLDAWAPDSIGLNSIALGYNTKAIASYSTALGYQTNANGYASTVMGYNTTADDNYATAMGFSAKAKGNSSTAMGNNTDAVGAISTALGYYTTAMGYASTATGYYTNANGYASTSMGFDTKSDAYSGFSLGRYNVGGGSNGSWISTDPLFEIGNGLSEVARKNAMTVLKNGDLIVGRATVPPATPFTDSLMYFDKSKGAFRAGILSNSNAWAPDSIGSASIALGRNAKASGDYSTAIGSGTEAAGTYSTAIGSGIEAAGTYSTAMGSNTMSNGNASTAMGANTMANGTASTAMGANTVANGNFSFSIGFGAKSDAAYSMALGRFNVGTGDSIYWVVTDPLFEIGSGTSNENRKNALTVLKNGNTGIGIATPDSPLQIFSDASSTIPQLKLTESIANDGARIIFDNSIETANRWTLYGRADNTDANSTFNLIYNGIGNIITADGLGKVGIKGNPDADFHLYHGNSGGSGGLKLQNSTNDEFARLYVSSGDGNLRIYFDTSGLKGTFNDVTGVYSTVSDRRLKDNFEDLAFDWNTFSQLTPLSYTYKHDNASKRYIGMIAQDVKEIYPELINYAADEDIYTMDYSGFGVIAIKAVQELKVELDEKNALISNLSEMVRMQQEIQVKQDQSLQEQSNEIQKLQMAFAELTAIINNEKK